MVYCHSTQDQPSSLCKGEGVRSPIATGMSYLLIWSQRDFQSCLVWRLLRERRGTNSLESLDSVVHSWARPFGKPLFGSFPICKATQTQQQVQCDCFHCAQWKWNSVRPRASFGILLCNIISTVHGGPSRKSRVSLVRGDMARVFPEVKSQLVAHKWCLGIVSRAR